MLVLYQHQNINIAKNSPTLMQRITFVIFGVTGDLAKRKILPAIYGLLKNHQIQKVSIVGVARRNINSSEILAEAIPFINKVNKTIWKKLSNSFYYQQLEFDHQPNYHQLGELLDQIDRKNQFPSPRLFYLATLPEHFGAITNNLAKSGIAKSSAQKWCRLVYEKPFGSDLLTARKINQGISKVFKEQQVFRIDHYLGKELVGNISILRFANRVLEPLWNEQHIDSIQIVLNEKIGIEGRGNFYDKYGALKDVIQNHLLQMLALVGMEPPQKLTGDYIRQEKAKVLKKITVKDALFGQYNGYASEPGVKANSNTETFVALKVIINNRRWRGVPIYLKSGKSLSKKQTNIHIIFKEAKCLLDFCPTEANVLTIRVQPEEGFELKLFAKVPGEQHRTMPVKMEFRHSCITKHKSPEAYEVLLLDVIRGDQSLFVRKDEIELAWKIVDGLKENGRVVYNYPPGSSGPLKLQEFEKKHHMRWLT